MTTKVSLGVVAANAVDTAQLASAAVETASIAGNAVVSAKIAANQIITAKIASNAITSGHITSGEVTTDHLADNAITTDKIAANAITLAKITSGTLTADSLADNSITGAKIAQNSIDSSEIVSGSIDTVHIADSQVTNAKLANSSVTVNSNSVALGASITLDTDDIGEGSSNLYYTDARAQAVSINNVVEDTTPQLGGDLASNGNDILFADDDKAIFGAGSDLQIYHDGSNSYIKENGTGALNIAGQGNINFTNSAGNANLAKFTEGSSVKLYYDNDLKFTTSSTGIDVTGNITISGTVDGRDLATDGTKLDGIESGATADQTASEILTLIKTVDGAGSGLDADTLDGISSASFLRSDADDTLSGNLTVTGNLTVQGTTVTLEATTLNVEDKNITLNYSTGDSSGSANGAGITIQDAVDSTTDATILWNATNDRFEFSHDVDLPIDSAKIRFGGSSIGGPHGLTFYDDDGTSSFSMFYRTSPETITLEIEGDVAKHTFERDGDYTAAGTVTASGGNSGNWNTAYGWGNHASAGYITGNQTITLSGDVSGSGTTSISVTVADDSHNHVISNIDGLQTALDSKAPTSTTVTTNTTQTISGEKTFNSQINLGNVTSTGSSYLSGTQRIVSDGYIATQAIYNYGETGSSPAAIVFGNGSTYSTDQISLITSGVTALYIDSSQNITVAGTVDGRDLATDGTKLDGIAAGATNTAAPFYTSAITSSDVTTALGYTPYQENTALSATTGVFSSNVNIDRCLFLDARYDGADGDNVLAFQDSGGNYSIRHNVNDGNGNYSISLGYSGAGNGQYYTTGDGVGKILFGGHGIDGYISLNAATTGTAGTNISFGMGLLVDHDSIRVGASSDGSGLQDGAGTRIFDASGNSYANSYNLDTGQILADDGTSNYIKGGSSGAGILYTEASTFYVNNPMNLNVGRGVVYFENNSNSNADGAGVTLRTSSNPNSGSIFDVRSSGQACRFFVGQNITTAGDNPFYVGDVSTGGESTASNYEILLNTNGDITAEGNITAYGSVSDIRQKENIEQIDKPIERLEKIKGITFNYKKKSADERLMGVIAQELLEDDILKLAVYEQEDFKAEDDDPLKHTYGVRYEHLTAILIEAVKEQQEQIEELTSRINDLEKGE